MYCNLLHGQVIQRLRDTYLTQKELVIDHLFVSKCYKTEGKRPKALVKPIESSNEALHTWKANYLIKVNVDFADFFFLRFIQKDFQIQFEECILKIYSEKQKLQPWTTCTNMNILCLEIIFIQIYNSQ